MHPLARAELLSRRRLLQSGLGLVIGGPALLAACSDSGSTVAGPTTTAGTATAPSTTLGPTSTAAPTTTVGYDASQPYWLQGGFAPVFDELSTTDLVVEGSIPPSLHGLYARNGSNPATGTSPHWFFGDGMVHGVRFEHGKAAWYGNKWVDTPLMRAKAQFGEFDGPPGTTSSQSNVSVFWHGGRLLSLGEVGWPYELDPSDLSTMGPVELSGPAGSIGPNATAHPKRDPATGLLHFFGYGFTPPYLTYYVASPDGRQLIHSEEIPVGASTMIHDFAITETDVIFWEMPVVFNLQAAIDGAENPFQWTPTYGSRLGIMPLGGPSTEMTWIEIDNGYVFHGTNAHRDGDRIVLDVSKLPSMFSGGVDGPSLLTRWEVDLGGSTPSVKETTLDAEVPMDLPEVDERYTGRKHSVAWYLDAVTTDDGNLEFRGLTRRMVADGAVDRWSHGSELQPTEPLFVPDTPDSPEGEGWILSFVWDKTDNSSFLAIFDSTDMAGGPVGKVYLPRRVPFGFHGTWVPGPV